MKRHTAESVGHVAFNLEDVRDRCDQYRESTRGQCVELIEQARAEAEEIRRQASVDGHSEGYRNGLKRAEQLIEDKSGKKAELLIEEQLQTVIPALSQMVDELAAARNHCLADWESELVQLSVAIAERIIRREVEVNPQTLTSIVGEAVHLAFGSTQVDLNLNPLDLDALGDRVRTTVQESGPGIEVNLRPDDSVTRGGCIVTTKHGQIDARIETMLQRVSEELLEGIAPTHEKSPNPGH